MSLRVDFSPSPELYPFEPHWFDAGGVRLHYVDEGTGMPIVMFHGNGSWSFLYRKLIQRLRDRFRCIAPDYPGFGLSDHPDDYRYTPQEHATLVGRLVDSLGLDRFVVMGQDWGGPIGMRVALERAARVSGLVFMNTWFWPADPFFWAFSFVMSTPPMQSRIRERHFFVETIVPNSVSTPLPAEVFEHYRRVQPSPEYRRGVAEFPRQIRIAKAWLADLAQRAPRELANVPLLLIWGMKDRGFGNQRIVARWRRAFPRAEVIVLAGASHYIQEDAPDEIAAAVRRRFG